MIFVESTDLTRIFTRDKITTTEISTTTSMLYKINKLKNNYVEYNCSFTR